MRQAQFGRNLWENIRKSRQHAVATELERKCKHKIPWLDCEPTPIHFVKWRQRPQTRSIDQALLRSADYHDDRAKSLERPAPPSTAD